MIMSLLQNRMQMESLMAGQTCGDGLQDQGSHLPAVHQAHVHVTARLHPGHHLQPLHLASWALRVDQVQTACTHDNDAV